MHASLFKPGKSQLKSGVLVIDNSPQLGAKYPHNYPAAVTY